MPRDRREEQEIRTARVFEVITTHVPGYLVNLCLPPNMSWSRKARRGLCILQALASHQQKLGFPLSHNRRVLPEGLLLVFRAPLNVLGVEHTPARYITGTAETSARSQQSTPCLPRACLLSAPTHDS